MENSASSATLPLRDWIDLGSGPDRRRLVLAIRSVVVVTVAYLVIASTPKPTPQQLLFLAAFFASNVALAAAPSGWFCNPRFGPLLLLADTGAIVIGLSWAEGFSQDLLLVYFFTIFLVSIGETLGQIAIGSALVAGMYGYWLWLNSAGTPAAAAWVRLPFFFLVAVFYAYLIQQLKAERQKRREAEQESRQLRLLLDLASAFSESHVTDDFVRGMGRFVESACPGISCNVVADGDLPPAGNNVAVFPLRAHGRGYGALLARSQGRRPVDGRERWICQIVAHTAASALYASEQSTAAKTATAAKEQFLATVSHEFRTPLHALLGYIEIVDGTVGENPDVRESLERMRINACRLKNLLEELLTFAEVRAGHASVAPEEISLCALVDELAPAAERLLADKNVTVSWQVDSDAEWICSDRRKLEHIVSCLLSNAAKFTERGRIHVMVRAAANDQVEIAVSDTGIGIASTDLAVICDDFRQVDGSMTRRYGGLGVGLALVNEIAAILGGSLSLESELGRGTTARVRLPRRSREKSDPVAVDFAGFWDTAGARKPPAATRPAAERPRLRRVG
jgi:signal transduction histidine kinase